jgi:LmbE family N-acetylglucosaminyl deacetylase
VVGTPRILAILAHPGEETWALGAALARYVDEGARVHLVCATRGEGGPFGSSAGAFPPAVLGRIRERELEAAAGILGLHDVEVLGYPDGGVASVDPFRAQMELAARIRRARPHVVITWGPQGPAGDADRGAVGEATQGAVLAAARHSAPVPGGLTPHAVRKVYHRVWSRPPLRPGTRGCGTPAGPGGGLGGDVSLVPGWMVTTVLETHQHADRAREALARHGSRSPEGAPSSGDAGGIAPWLWARAEFTRSLNTVAVPGGREADLLAGIRSGEGSVRVA